MKQFAGRVAAVTGAGSGMGRALAFALVARGCHVAVADIDDDALAETEQGCRAAAAAEQRVSRHRVDVADREQVERFAADVVATHGCVHLIFNNAGVSVTDTVEHMSYENFEWLMGINFWGVVYGSKAFLPHLRQVDEAHIVNTSSIFGTIAVPSQSAYNASKFAVRGFTDALRMELADTHIAVSCVQPGGVKTNIVKRSRYVPTDNSAATREEMIARFDQLAGLTAEQAAAQILRGVGRGKARILVGQDARLLALLERLAPLGYGKLLARLFDRDRPD